VKGACICGDVTVEVPGRPELMNACNCSVCWKLGAMWGYYPRNQVTITGTTIGYRRTDVAEPSNEFQSCARCGATVAEPRLQGAADVPTGINMRLFDPSELKGVELVFGDARNRVNKDDRPTYRPAEPFDGAGWHE
jgi:hypothetical protein